jgi:PAS domain S-box-containing protein
MVGVNIDVTGRKLAEQELATTSERLHLAMESGSVGGWDYDVKSGKAVLFGMAHAQLGMSPNETSGSPAEFWDHVHEDDRERYRSAIAAAREKKEHFEGEFRVVWRDGTIRWLRTRGRYNYAADGDPERLLGISVDITERKQAEQTLRESEQRLRLATQVGRMYAYDWDVTKDVVVRSSEHVKILGLTEPMHFPQQQFVDKIHPDDRPKFLAAIARLTPENPTDEVTYRAFAPDGTLVWLKSNGRGFFDGEGRLLRVIGMVADVTDQKLADEALSEMSRKLLAAQEQERARIARELHDDINQRIAMLALELEQLQGNPSEVMSRTQELRKQMSEISEDVQAISHDLHSPKLEYLGVVAGMKSWCKEFGVRRRMEIDFKSDVSSDLPHEIGLSLFRVLQEALHNVIKHSGVRGVEVELWEDSSEIHLIVRDSGRGFEVEAALQGKGLGLTSMRERVRLVSGAISIESKPMGGTVIHVRVPLESEHAAEQQAV